MTLNDILKNRSKIRNGVREEMQKILNGWGIWLETIEIQDVKIASSTLFKNLQTEFRESSRLQAERITEESNLKIAKEKLERDEKFSKKDNQVQVEASIYAEKEKLANDKQALDFKNEKTKVEVQEYVVQVDTRINNAKRAYDL